MVNYRDRMNRNVLRAAEKLLELANSDNRPKPTKTNPMFLGVEGITEEEKMYALLLYVSAYEKGTSVEKIVEWLVNTVKRFY